MGKPAVTHRLYIHGHDMYLLSRGMFRLVGFVVRSAENRHYLGPDHVGSNHARQIQGELQQLLQELFNKILRLTLK